MSGDDAAYVCIECGVAADQLYRQYETSVIKVCQCRACEKTVDKYIESEPVLILLDGILHKQAAYRHVLYNADVAWYKKLLVILLLCQAYHHCQTNNPPPRTEIHYYRSLGYTMLDWVLTVVLVWLFLNLLTQYMYKKKEPVHNMLSVLRCLVISSYGKLLIVPACIWLNEDTSHCWTLIQTFILTSNIAALKARFNQSITACLSILVIVHIVRWLLFMKINDLSLKKY